MTTGHRIALTALAIVCTAPAAAGAQVGHPPEASPYTDLLYKQEVTVETGYFRPRRDPAGAAPQGGPMVGVRYAVQFANPVVVAARIGTAFSTRDVLDPAAPPAQRILRRESTQLGMADVALGMAFTGFRAWNDFVPEATLGAGVVSDFKGADEGGYRFGTPLALSLTGGARWVPGGRWQMRADITDRLYKISYPQSYYQTTGGEAVLGARESNSLWTHNPTISIGISWLFDR